MYGCELAAVYLISNKAFINAKDVNGDTPLHWSIKNYVRRPNIDCFKKLLMNGADRNIKNKDDKTPLDCLMELKDNS